MAVLLLNPPNPKGFQANRDFMGNYGMLNTRPGIVLPPLHLIQMGGTVPAEEVFFLDAAAEGLSLDETRERIRNRPPDISIVLTSTPTFDEDCQMARWLKSISLKPVYLYGPHPAHVQDEAFEKSDADGIVVGYTPKTLPALLAGPKPALEEIIYPGHRKDPPPVAPAFNLDDLPYGCWEKAPLYRYRFNLHEPIPFATMRTSLGCVYTCAYCPYVVAEGNRFLAMSSDRIYSEMEYLSSKFGVRYILFRDLLFTAQKKRIELLCQRLIEHPLPLKWRCETSTQHLTSNLVSLLARAGCTGINLGVETIDDLSASEMDLISKRRDLDHLQAMFRSCREHGIKANALFVFGFPADQRSGILKTIAFAKNLDADTVQFCAAVPYPGTQLFRLATQEGLIETSKWEDYSSLRPVMHTRHLAKKDVQELIRSGLRSFYLKPTRIKRLAGHPADLLRRTKAFVNFYLRR